MPELSAVQCYYLSQEFPVSRILFLNDLLERGNEIFTEDFDFLILPGWAIEDIPEGIVNFAINMRSFMEMIPDVITYYFLHIQRIMRNHGLFSCFNRYAK